MSSTEELVSQPRTRGGGVLLDVAAVTFHHNDFDVRSAVAALDKLDRLLYDKYTDALRHASQLYAGSVAECHAHAMQESDVTRDMCVVTCATPGGAEMLSVDAGAAERTCASWSVHYSHSKHHFPLKNYILRAFPLLQSLSMSQCSKSDEAKKSVPTILECGCGTGSTLLPIMHACAPGSVRFIGVDVAACALDHFAQHPLACEHAQAGMLHLFPYGMSWCSGDATHTPSLRRTLNNHGLDCVAGNGCDAVLFVFVLSALPSVHSMLCALRDARDVLAADGVLLIRDFALPDHNFFRYARKCEKETQQHVPCARKRERGEGGCDVSDMDATLRFCKPDGTTQIFFDEAFVLWLTAQAGLSPSPDPSLALTLHCNRLVNRKTKVQMNKVFVNGGFVRTAMTAKDMASCKSS